MATTAEDIIERMWRSGGVAAPTTVAAPKEAWTRHASPAARPRPPATMPPAWAGRLRQKRDEQARREATERQNHESRRLLQDSFDVVATDGDRTLDEQGVAAVLQLLGMPMEAGPLHDAMAQMQPGSDGRVGVDGFAAWYIRAEKQNRAEELRRIREAFELLDRDGSGALDKSEVAQLSKRLGNKLTSVYSSKKLNVAFAEMDPNGDGLVTSDEFRDWWMRNRAAQRKEQSVLLSDRLAKEAAEKRKKAEEVEEERVVEQAAKGATCKDKAREKWKDFSVTGCIWRTLKGSVRCFILLRQMKRDKRGLSNAISMACARRKKDKKKAEQLTDSDDDIIDMVSSESEYEESEVDEAEQEEQRKQLMLEYAEYLGLNIYKHHSLIWIAAEALCCPLPDGWKEYVDGDENVFFFEKDEEATEEEEELAGVSTFAHPMEAVYREQIKKCVAALEDDDSEELEFLKDETLGIAIALSDRPPEKEPTARELFDEVDDDGSGYLDRLEVATLCSKLGSTLPAHVLNEAMAEMDKDGNDEVSYEEFDAWWSDKTATERRQRQFRDAFDVVDQRGKGSLPKAGLQRVLQRLGDGLSPRELQTAFSEIQGLQKELIRDDVRKAFDLADLAGEGKIPKAKVAAVAEHLNASSIVAENALEMGSGSDGQERISFDVVAAWWDDQWEKERKRKQVHEAFERVDEDGSGSLDFHEVKLFLSRLGDQIGRSAAKVAFDEMSAIDRDQRARSVANAFQEAGAGEPLNERQANAAVESLRECLRGEEFDGAFEQMSKDAAGLVTEPAFAEWYEQEQFGEFEDDSEFREIFHRVDVDGSGTVDKVELEEVADELGERLSSVFSSRQLDEAFEEMSPDEDGEVSFASFRHWWLRRRQEREESQISLKTFEVWYWGRIAAEQEAEESRIKDLFQRIDADGSGQLDKSEVERLAAELGEKLTSFGKSGDLDDAFAEMDPDGSEAVTLDEFRTWWLQKKQPPEVEYKAFEVWYWKRLQDQDEQEEERVRELFERTDTDGSGALDREEVAALSAELGEKLTTFFGKKKLDDAFAEMDPSGDGEVSFTEFRDWWFRKLDKQRKREEEARDLQFRKDAFWARRGRGQATQEEPVDVEPPRMPRRDVRTRLLFRAVMQEDIEKIEGLIAAGVDYENVRNRAGQTVFEVAETAGKTRASTHLAERRK